LQVKAAFTRAYQKNPPMLPYTIGSNATAKKKSVQNDDYMEEEEDEEENDDIGFDKMIKVTKIIFMMYHLYKQKRKKKKCHNIKMYFRQRNLLLLVVAKLLHRQTEIMNQAKNVEKDVAK